MCFHEELGNIGSDASLFHPKYKIGRLSAMSSQFKLSVLIRAVLLFGQRGSSLHRKKHVISWEACWQAIGVDVGLLCA